MMLDNSKRMQKLQSFLDDDKKAKKSSSKARRRKATVVTESSSTDRSERSSERSIAGKTPAIDFKTILSVQESWRQVARNEMEIGESIILQMIDIDFACRQQMKIISFRSDQFKSLCRLLVHSLGEYIDSLSPDMDEEDIGRVAATLVQNGISVSILTEVLPDCVSSALEVSNSSEQEHWQQVGRHFRHHAGVFVESNL